MPTTTKPHAAYKTVLPRSQELETKILDTTSRTAKIVGTTLGPGGHPVLLERAEVGLPPMITKDGVTVFKSLGYRDSTEQNILEAMRDASVRTAIEAGDGTTTATILADAFVRYTLEYCNENPNTPPIKVVQKIQKVFENKIVPEIDKCKISCSLGTEDGLRLLKSVATLSANGDTDLADAVMQCYGICGDDGNVTIVDCTGPTKNEVEEIKGFPIAMGYERSCAKYYTAFINDSQNQRILADKPIFVLYFGKLNDIQNLLPILRMISDGYQNGWVVSHNVVVVATGFSESVLTQFVYVTADPSQINIFPMLVPDSPILNGDKAFLDDLAAITHATVFDPISKPLESAIMSPGDDEAPAFTDFGNLKLAARPEGGDPVWMSMDITHFESGRYRSSIIGFAEPDGVLDRIDVVKQQLKAAESKLETDLINERVAKLSGGIAKLKVMGASQGELKERRDRAEDAVCAVRGALKYGALIGGGWMLARLINILDSNDPIEEGIVKPALWEPIITLYSNAGLSIDSDFLQSEFPFKKKFKASEIVVRDISQNIQVKALETGILDSLPAVREALKNSISIATLLGTLGGCVVYPRDKDVDNTESREHNEFMRNAGWNPADERP